MIRSGSNLRASAIHAIASEAKATSYLFALSRDMHAVEQILVVFDQKYLWVCHGDVFFNVYRRTIIEA